MGNKYNNNEMKFLALLGLTSAINIKGYNGGSGPSAMPTNDYALDTGFCDLLAKFKPDPIKFNGLIRLPNMIEFVEHELVSTTEWSAGAINTKLPAQRKLLIHMFN